MLNLSNIGSALSCNSGSRPQWFRFSKDVRGTRILSLSRYDSSKLQRKRRHLEYVDKNVGHATPVYLQFLYNTFPVSLTRSWGVDNSRKLFMFMFLEQRTERPSSRISRSHDYTSCDCSLEAQEGHNAEEVLRWRSFTALAGGS